MELSSDGRVSVALQNFHSQVKKLIVQEAGKPASGARQLARVTTTSQPLLFSSTTNVQSAPASPEAAKPSADTSVVSAGGVSLPQDIAGQFGNVELPHNALPPSVRGKPLAIRGKATNQPKEQDDNAS